MGEPPLKGIWGKPLEAETSHVTGGCLCSRIRYEAEVFLQNGYICHCTTCQKRPGQPALLVPP